MNRLLCCLPLLAAVSLASAQNVSLEDTDWRLQSLADQHGILQPVADGIDAGIRFSAGKLGGKGGCNGFFGHYQHPQPGQLSVGEQIGSTMMACAPPMATLEHRYLQLLPKVSGYRIGGERLLLLDTQGTALLDYLVVVALQPEGVDWQAGGINNGRGGVVTTATTSRSTARFGNGEVSGNAGCNRYSASYTVTDGALSVGAARTTRMMCAEPGLMDQEQQFLAALSRASVVQLRERKLELRDAEGALQASFVAAQHE